MTLYLMHKDDKVALFKYEEGSITYISVNPAQGMERLLPVGVRDKASLKGWITNRAVPVTRDQIRLDLLSMKNMTPFKLMLKNLGLSLTDCYWIKEIDQDFTWSDVNLYENDFKSAYSLDLQDDMPTIAGKTNFVPSASLKGDLKKKWIIDQNGIRRLVKGNYGGGCRQSLCEVLASELHRMQGKFAYTPYSLIKITSGGSQITGCTCPGFCDNETELVSAYEIVSCGKKRGDQSYYEYLIEQCMQHGVSVRDFLEYQIMTDFLISNTDRHFNNFGVLRDSGSLEWKTYAPIFDSGNSMFYNSSFIPSGKDLLDLRVTSFLQKEVSLLKYVKDRGLVDLSRLPSDEFVYELFLKDIGGAEGVEKLVKAWREKIRFLEDFQNGADLWSHSYLPKIG